MVEKPNPYLMMELMMVGEAALVTTKISRADLQIPDKTRPALLEWRKLAS